MAAAPKKIKRSSASLTGGFVVGLAAVVIVLLICGELGVLSVGTRWSVAILVGLIMGCYVRIADL